MNKLVENYLLLQSVGKGAFGKVYRAIHQKSREEYAVKVIPKSVFQKNPKLEQLAINEIKILSSLRNEHIVRFIETLKTPTNFYFVYEFCNGGNLDELLRKKKTLKETEALGYISQLLDAFKQLNKNNVMHRDLKPDNIFLSDDKIKLGDFGFCKMLQVNMATTMLGSPIYMAPQILREQIYTAKADIWSLGVVLFEMLFGFCPFESNSISQLINVLKKTDLTFPTDINSISQSTKDLLQKILVKDQFKRIQWVDLFQYRLDSDGKLTCPVKKDYSHIQTLENYFLFNQKGVQPKPLVSDYEIEIRKEKVGLMESPNMNSGKYSKSDRFSSNSITNANNSVGFLNQNRTPKTVNTHHQISSLSRQPFGSPMAKEFSIPHLSSDKILGTGSPRHSSTRNLSTMTSTFGEFGQTTNPTFSETSNAHPISQTNNNIMFGTESYGNIGITNMINHSSCIQNTFGSQKIGSPTTEKHLNFISGSEKIIANFQSCSSYANNYTKQKEKLIEPPQLNQRHSQPQLSPQNIGTDIELKHTLSGTQYKRFSDPNNFSIARKNSTGATFQSRHQKWTKALELMEELSKGPKQASETFIYWLLVALSRKLNSQAINHPEWTDIIIEQRKSINQALREISAMDQKFKVSNLSQGSSLMIDDGKNQILKLWKRNSQWDIKENLFEKAIRFMYGTEANTELNFEQLLLT